MERHQSALPFLQEASLDRLEQAAAWNHHMWMARRAQAMGGEVHESDGVAWAYIPGPDKRGDILFPRLIEANAGAQIDTIVSYFRERGVSSVGCWSLLPTQPPDLGVRLVARGFQWGWQPRWMWLDMDKMPTEPLGPADLRIDSVEGPTDWDLDDLPYYDRKSESVRRAVIRQRPQRTWHFAAWLDDVPVGHSTVFLSTGDMGIAGIYDVGVVPAARKKGVGKAITVAACLQARKMGCRHVMLNGTGERMYRQIGFERIGFGMTWWLQVDRLEANPPTPKMIAFAEAVGRGDIDSLNRLEKELGTTVFEAPLTNGTTPMNLAVKERQATVVQWLVDRGVVLDVLSAWDLDWKERIPLLLAENPDLVNRRSGDRGMTPLHIAVRRGDTQLARLLLNANPDLERKDSEFGGTPLGWAKRFQRTEIVALIEAHQAGDGD